MMDPETGRVARLEPGQSPNPGWLVFEIGEEIIIKGHAFRVKRVKTKALHLEPICNKQMTKEKV